MRERLTDLELADMERYADSDADVFNLTSLRSRGCILRAVEEIRSHRAALLNAIDISWLSWLHGFVEFQRPGHDSLATLAKIIAANPWPGTSMHTSPEHSPTDEQPWANPLDHVDTCRDALCYGCRKITSAAPTITPELAQQLADEGAAASKAYIERARAMLKGVNEGQLERLAAVERERDELRAAVFELCGMQLKVTEQREVIAAYRKAANDASQPFSIRRVEALLGTDLCDCGESIAHTGACSFGGR